MSNDQTPVDLLKIDEEDGPPLEAGVACERTYQILVDGGPQPLLCRWFTPQPWGRSWLCRTTMTMADGQVRSYRTGGVDSVQALVLAMNRVADALLEGDIPAYWFEQDDDLGLPYMDYLAEEMAARKIRFEAK
ncbi:DUF6968 family protein [Caulobacter hibisci]|uniref:DUF6968 domain-containing protein n=1 Tax=Caulobacter hibisci TaxID=2035993 RepID=A0ABS0T3I8_9CAUL|nr:hypothetical protein [Caulobacter hibisci]MBI1685650.1 hypothetical protein [Caulobacter hibisci]